MLDVVFIAGPRSYAGNWRTWTSNTLIITSILSGPKSLRPNKYLPLLDRFNFKKRDVDCPDTVWTFYPLIKRPHRPNLFYTRFTINVTGYGHHLPFENSRKKFILPYNYLPVPIL